MRRAATSRRALRERDLRRAAGVVARRGAGGSSWNSTSSTSGSSAVVMGGFESGTESVLFDTGCAALPRELALYFVVR